MKNNKLSVFTFRYRKAYYLKHPWKWFYDLYWNIRNFIHRGRYGFAYADVWNWYSWWTQVGAEALRYLAEHGNGYPGCEPWETYEKWEKHLLKTADDLEWCGSSYDFDKRSEGRNEYEKLMRTIWDKNRETRERAYDDGKITNAVTYTELTVDEEEIRRKYWAREEEISKEDDEQRIKIFSEIGKNLGRYWD